MLARARSRKLSRLEPPRDTPTIGNGACPRLSIQCSAGKIFLNARSPVAPNSTNASESGSAIAHSLSGAHVRHKVPQATIVPFGCRADMLAVSLACLVSLGPRPQL